MAVIRAWVAEIATLAGHLRVRWRSERPTPAAPGQFYLAWAPLNAHPFLRLPVFPVADAGPEAELWLEPAHPYAALEPGAELQLAGPLGRSLPWPERTARVLLVGQTLTHLWPVLTWALTRGWAAAWLWPEVLPADLLDVLPPSVEAARGPVTPELAEWADVAILDVPDPAASARALRHASPLKLAGTILAFQHPAMPCGFGGCQGCWVETRRGRRLACVDGPVLPI